MSLLPARRRRAAGKMPALHVAAWSACRSVEPPLASRGTRRVAAAGETPARRRQDA
jgi:hypothetical protein